MSDEQIDNLLIQTLEGNGINFKMGITLFSKGYVEKPYKDKPNEDMNLHFTLKDKGRQRAEAAKAKRDLSKPA